MFMPVSYTHLDVYKRQIYLVGFSMGGVIASYLAATFQVDRLVSVSYTHLAFAQKVCAIAI